jgi:hypothetical protein
MVNNDQRKNDALGSNPQRDMETFLLLEGTKYRFDSGNLCPCVFGVVGNQLGCVPVSMF